MQSTDQNSQQGRAKSSTSFRIMKKCIPNKGVVSAVNANHIKGNALKQTGAIAIAFPQL